MSACNASSVPLWMGPRAHWQAWAKHGVSRKVLKWIRYGVTIQGEAEVQPFDEGPSVCEGEMAVAWAQMKLDLMGKGAIKQLAHPTRFRSKAFLVPKKEVGAYRLICDLRPFNKGSPPVECDLDTLYTLHQDVVKGAEGFVIDLKDGYYQLGVHPSCQQYFCFTMNGEHFCYTGLPMGWNQAPGVFAAFTREVAKILNRTHTKKVVVEGGVRYHCKQSEQRTRVYLDDFLFLGHNHVAGCRLAKKAKKLFKELGLIIKESKSNWVPSTRFTHLGLIVDTVLMEMVCPVEKLQRIKGTAKHLLSIACKDARRVVKRQLAQFAGLCNSVSLALPPVRFFLRSMFDAMKKVGDYNQKVRLPHQAIHDLKWWAKLPARWNGRAMLQPAARVQLVSDASDLGWACLYENNQAHGFWTMREKQLPIHIREMLALKYGLQSFAEHVRGKTIRALIDNSALVHTVGKGYVSKEMEFMEALRGLFWVVDSLQVKVLPVYVPSAENAADALSRLRDNEDWCLGRSYFQLIEQLWGPHTIDRFASHTSHLLPVYNSYYYDPCSSGVDAFAQGDWGDHNNYANPPWSLIPELVHFIQGLPHLQLTLVVPDWPTQAWYGQLMALGPLVHRIPKGAQVFSSTLHGGRVYLNCKWPVLLCRLEW